MMISVPLGFSVVNSLFEIAQQRAQTPPHVKPPEAGSRSAPRPPLPERSQRVVAIPIEAISVAVIFQH